MQTKAKSTVCQKYLDVVLIWKKISSMHRTSLPRLLYSIMQSAGTVTTTVINQQPYKKAPSLIEARITRITRITLCFQSNRMLKCFLLRCRKIRTRGLIYKNVLRFRLKLCLKNISEDVLTFDSYKILSIKNLAYAGSKKPICNLRTCDL